MKDKFLMMTATIGAVIFGFSFLPATADAGFEDGFMIRSVDSQNGHESIRGLGNTVDDDEEHTVIDSGPTVEALVRVPVVFDRPRDGGSYWSLEIIDSISGKSIYSNAGVLDEQGRTVTEFGDVGIFYAEWSFDVPVATMEIPRPLEIRALIDGAEVSSQWFSWDEKEYYFFDHDESATDHPLFLMYSSLQIFG